MFPFIFVPMTPLETVAVQARTEARDTHGTDPNDFELEVAPQVRYDALWDHANSHFVAIYIPHLIFSNADADASQNIDGKASFLQLHQVNMGVELERQRYHVATYGNFAYGPVSSTALLAAFTKPWLGEGIAPFAEHHHSSQIRLGWREWPHHDDGLQSDLRAGAARRSDLPHASTHVDSVRYV